MFDSFLYTQAMKQNWENVMVTSDKDIVNIFHKEFKHIWDRPEFIELIE